MSPIHEANREGGAPAAPGSAALRAASRGIRTVRDCANLTLGIALDALTGHVGSRNGNLALRGMEGVRRFIETGQRHGQYTDVVEGQVGTMAEAEAAGLLRREQELTAELEAIRERRGAAR